MVSQVRRYWQSSTLSFEHLETSYPGLFSSSYVGLFYLSRALESRLRQ